MIPKITFGPKKAPEINTLLVVFSGFRPPERRHLGGPPNFSKILQDTSCYKMFVQDMTYSWYNHSNVRETITNRIVGVQQQHSFDKVVFLGGSMGGFGTVLFSHWCHCDVALAFSPQILADPDVICEWDAMRSRQIRMGGVPDGQYKYVNANDFRNDTTQYHLFCGKDNVNDCRHISNIDDAPNVTKHFLDTPKHPSAFYLKSKGELLPLIESHL